MNEAHALPNHHPSDALLVDYGAGALGEGLSLAVALHLTRCPECRAALAGIDAVGGALLEGLPPDPLERLTLAGVLAELDRDPPMRPAPRPMAADPSLPGPLRGYVPSLAAAPWRRLAPGVRRVELMPRTPRGGGAQLLRIAPGVGVPHHGHRGLELTVVLSGAYSDGLARYAAGDLAEMDGDRQHQPVADSGDECVCVIATEAPLRFTGLLGRLMQPLIRL
ncbi:ChrR family anti-sigma-E factor [Azospirillum doebereinerae]|uniref:Transcriptional regulator n=1 Tax=Azospirillum doebereinerae TaxID=92933 RepID=A0A3S0UZF1_9PROT|nr:ChrR family anti-sigma-E factor [Azospirillum doebereinerae]RUQ66839.1 transcriptional regulator [Azospirillum doebereinerae]